MISPLAVVHSLALGGLGVAVAVIVVWVVSFVAGLGSVVCQ